MKDKNIGRGIKAPKKPKGIAVDKKCPFTGNLKVRGRSIVGTVVGAKMRRTAIVEWIRREKIPKYERYMKKRTRVKAHNPDIIKAEVGDVVRIMETRPLSKTVQFVIVEKKGKERGFVQRMEALEESKKVKPKMDDVKKEEVIEENKENASS